MRLFLSVFLLFTIVSGLAISVIQQISDVVVYELKESKSDDNNNDSDEKESKIEKDLFINKLALHISREAHSDNYNKTDNHQYDGDLIHSLYNSLPYNPPEL